MTQISQSWIDGNTHRKIRMAPALPVDGEASRQIYAGIDPKTDEILWTVERVDEHPEDGTYVCLRSVDESTGVGPVRIADASALRGLASVLLAQARLLEIETPGATAAKSGHADVSALLESWEAWGNTDSWDVAAGLVAGHQQFAERISHMGADLTAALDGDESAALVWELEQMSGPQRDQDIADVLGIPVEELRTRLSAWAELGQAPASRPAS